MNQSLKAQEEALQELKSFLNEFAIDLGNKLKTYKMRVDKIHDNGLTNEVYYHYLNDNYSQDKSYINNLIKHIENTNIPYINKNIGATEDSKETARGRFKTIKLDD